MLNLYEDVCAACFANRTEYILVGTNNGEIQFWNHSYRCMLGKFSDRNSDKGHKKKITKLQVDDDIKKCLSISEDGFVKIWFLDHILLLNGEFHAKNGDLPDPSPRVRQKNWKPLFGDNSLFDDNRTLSIDNDKLISASFSNQNDDEYMVVTGSAKGVVTVWKMNKEIVVQRCQKPVTCCTFSEDDKLVLFGCGNVVFVYDWMNEGYLSQFVNDEMLKELLSIPDCNDMIVAVGNHTLTLWSWEEEMLEGGRIKLDKPKSYLLEKRDNVQIICATVTCDGQYLVAGTSDCNINVWSIYLKEKVKEITQHASGVVMCVDTCYNEKCFSNDMYILLSGSNDRTVRQWYVPLEKYNESNELLPINFATYWLKDNAPLTAAISSENKIKLYKGIKRLAWETVPLINPTHLAFPPETKSFDNEYFDIDLAIGLGSGLVYLFNLDTKTLRTVMNLEAAITYLEYVQHGTKTFLIAAASNGCLMTYCSGRSIRLKNRSGNQKTTTVKAFYLHSSQRLVTVENDGCMKIWELDGINGVLHAVHYEAEVTMAVMSLRQDWIALTLTNGKFKLYSLTQEGGKVECHFSQERRLDEEKPLRSCCFSNDASLLAIGKDSGDIVVSITFFLFLKRILKW